VTAPPRYIRLVVEYDGTDWSGWQRQAGHPTVQQAIEEALEGMCHHKVTLHGSGRTDAGVHARGQVASFRTETRIPALGFLRGLNSALPRSIGIREADEVDEAFDPRRSARGKHYRYQIWNRPTRAPLLDRYAYHVHQALDLPAMRAGAAHLLGEHDFSAFRASDCDRKNPVRVLQRVDLTEDDREPGLLLLDVEGTAFLKHMVRVIAGTLVDVGLGRMTADDVARALSSRDRTLAGKTAPARGLTLWRVKY
jgi:tRNA pseudouridine38-40 synthase